MLGRVARGFGWLAYLGLVAAAFGIAGYFSFSVFVRSGATAVPDLVGLPETEITGLLADQGLRVRRKYEMDRYDEAIPAGHVLEQSPGSGGMVKRGAAVEVAVSMGPERLTVPNLEGKTLQAAQVLLTSTDLSLGRIVNVYSFGVQPGTVVEQVPAPTSKVGRGTAVDLFLSSASRADRYVMPDLAYRDLEVARLFFERRGFRLGSIKFEPYEGFSPGVVLRQYPLPGHLLSRQDLISLVVTTTGTEQR
jgi:beta-lactam-binding protein with PASTA domain